MNDAKRTRPVRPESTWAERDEITNELIAATSRSKPQRLNAYADDFGGPVEIAKRLAAIINTSPFSMWSEAEGGDLIKEIYMLLPDMARSERANRLAVAFGQAAAGGMPDSMRMLVLVDWCGVALSALPKEGAAILRETIEVAHAVAALSDPQTYPGIDETLARLDHSEFKTGSAYALNDWARNAVEGFVDPIDFSAGSAPGFEAWYRAIDVLGSVETALGDEAEDAFEECERILGSYIYAWRPDATSANLPTCRTAVLRLLPGREPSVAETSGRLTDEERAEEWPEQERLRAYVRGALAEAGGSASGERRVLAVTSEVLLEAARADFNRCIERKIELLRATRLDGREMPQAIEAYRRALANRDTDSAFDVGYGDDYELEYVFGQVAKDGPADDRLSEIIDAIGPSPFAGPNERVFAAALKRLKGTQS